MLKEVTWPLPLEIKPGEVTRSAPKLLLEIVMNQAFWRESFERVELGDAICQVLEEDREKSVFTASQRENLIASMRLEGQQITPATINRYFLRILRAVHQATDVPEPKA